MVMSHATKQILMATDFSEGSDEALSAAIDLAKRTGAALQIVHVLENGADQFPFGLQAYDERASLVASIDRELARRCDWAAREGVAAQSRLVEENAVLGVLLAAREAGADLIVVGTHGRRGIAHALMGSVAERIVQRAACPVLTVPFSKKAA
jgi:nucleotide-binding universal stress UspA family protein